MKEKKKIPWEIIISTAFSGFGITILSWVKNLVAEYLTIGLLQEYGNIIVGLISFLVLVIVISINYSRMKRKFEKQTKDIEIVYSNNLNEIESERDLNILICDSWIFRVHLHPFYFAISINAITTIRRTTFESLYLLAHIVL